MYQNILSQSGFSMDRLGNFCAVADAGSIAIVANLVFMNDFMGWTFAMVDCIFYMYRGENLYWGVAKIYKIESI